MATKRGSSNFEACGDGRSSDTFVELLDEGQPEGQVQQSLHRFCQIGSCTMLLLRGFDHARRGLCMRIFGGGRAVVRLLEGDQVGAS